MSWNRRGVSASFWLLAGLPIVASFVQAAVALLGTSASGIPIIGGLKALFQSVPVFRAAAVVFRSSSAVVLLLFVLLTVAWVAQGIGLFVLRHRVFTLGATGFLTLFLALFELVYLPVLSADIPLVQAGGFMSIPVLTVGASWVASLSFEWDVTLDEAASDDLTTARQEVQTALDTFENRVVSERARNALRSFAPKTIEDYEGEAESFRNRCISLLDRIESLTEESMESRKRKEKAAQIRSEAEGLDPEGRADRLRRELKQGTTDRIYEVFGDFHQVSRYGRAYEVRNVRTYNELSLPALDGPSVQLGGDQHELADRLAEAAKAGDFEAVASAIDRSQDHRSELEATLDEHESAVAEALEAATESIDRAQDHLNGLHGAANDRLKELLMEGRVPENLSVPDKQTVSRYETEAKDALHEAHFTDAKQKAAEARDIAQSIELIAEFFGESVIATIEYGTGSIPIPDGVGQKLVAHLRIPFEQTYGVEYAVDGNTLTIAGGESDEGENGQPNRRNEQQNRRPQTDGADPDDVLYVLRELQSRAEASSTNNTIELQTETLPQKFVSDPLLSELESFAERQTSVVEVSVPEDPPPGFLSIQVADGVSPQRVIGDLQDQYANNR